MGEEGTSQETDNVLACWLSLFIYEVEIELCAESEDFQEVKKAGDGTEMSGWSGWESEMNRSKVKKYNEISIGAKACSQNVLHSPAPRVTLTPQLWPVASLIIKY